MLWPRLDFQAADPLELTNIIRDQRETVRSRLPRNQQIVRPDWQAFPLQFRTDVRRGFRSPAIQRHLKNSRNKAFDLLPFLRGILGLGEAAK